MLIYLACVCDGLVTVMNTSIPDYSNKINRIKQTLKTTIEIYNNQSEGQIEKANKDVQLQYKELTNMLENMIRSFDQLKLC